MPTWGGRAAIAALALLAVVAAVVLLVDPLSRDRRPKSCEGAVALCERRLDQVVFGATHNSYAASEQSGWRFASQRYGIARQLDDGIRALLLDVHFGVRDPANGIVRTDLRAEGSDRNKVARLLPPAALHVADRIAGRVGARLPNGPSVPYLCHTLCELGAEPLDAELGVIGRFLSGQSDQVLILIVEDYVPGATIARAFDDAGLRHDVVTLDRDGPLPTLGRLIAEGRRLVVFAEEKGGSPPWYMPAFSFMQDTPLGATRPRQLSCARYRGADNDPLLLINHWIPPFPPSPTANAAIGRPGFLRDRVQECKRERGAAGAIVAVDFYNRTSVVQVARQFNSRP